MAASSLRMGIDLGGTKIEGAVLTRSGEIVARRRIAAPRSDYCATIEAVAVLAEELLGDAGTLCTLGVGMPGAISPKSGLVQNANSTWLNGTSFHLDLNVRLRASFGDGVRFANDANCFTLSEATDGAGTGARTAFGVILGTGCGGGIVIDGRLVDGPRGIGGEWGHNPLPWPTVDELQINPCWCGRRGCLETWLSGPAVAADHRRVTGEVLTCDAIAASAANGDPRSQATLARHADRMGRALATVINLIDPDVIVIGGGLSALPHLYDAVPQITAGFVFADQPAVDIRPPRWGATSGVRGAAWLWEP